MKVRLVQTNIIIVQIVGVALIVLTVLVPQAKSREGMLFVILLANLLSCVQFYYADARAGLYGLIVTTVRSVVYWVYAEKNKRAPVMIFFLFVLLQTSATMVGWDGWLSALTFVLLLNTYGQWQTNERTLRVCLLISALVFGFYCFSTRAYTGAINKWLQATSTIIAMVRLKNNCHRGSRSKCGLFS